MGTFSPGPCLVECWEWERGASAVSTSFNRWDNGAAIWNHTCGSLVYLVLFCTHWKTGRLVSVFLLPCSRESAWFLSTSQFELEPVFWSLEQVRHSAVEKNPIAFSRLTKVFLTLHSKWGMKQIVKRMETKLLQYRRLFTGWRRSGGGERSRQWD